MSEVVLGGPDGILRLSDPEFPPVAGEAHAVRVELKVGQLRVSSVVATYGDGLRLIDFFDELAEAWRGWHGEKQWYDDGVNLILKATHDGRSSVKLDVYFSHPFSYTVVDTPDRPGDWRVSTSVLLELGQLGEKSEQIRNLLHRRGETASDRL